MEYIRLTKSLDTVTSDIEAIRVMIIQQEQQAAWFWQDSDQY